MDGRYALSEEVGGHPTFQGSKGLTRTFFPLWDSLTCIENTNSWLSYSKHCANIIWGSFVCLFFQLKQCQALNAAGLLQKLISVMWTACI